MATVSGTHTQTWDAEDILGINNPARGHWTCVGYAKSKGRRCQIEANQHNRAAAAVLLRSLARGSHTEQELRDILHEIAERLLCQRFHQDQADYVATRWHALIAANPPVANSNRPPIIVGGETHTQTSTSSQSSGRSTASAAQSRYEDAEQRQDLLEVLRRFRAQWMAELEEARERSLREAEAELQRIRREAAEAEARLHRIRREAEAHERAERERVDREAREQAERERLEREAEEQAERERIEREAQEQAERERLERKRAEQARAERERAEQEAAARERLRRQQERREREEAARERREQAARERAEKEQQEWQQSWDTYERDWANMSRINTTEIDEDVKDSVPWPVKSGKWRDVNPDNVTKFLQHAPDGVFDNRSRLRSLLRRQAVRWHEDKIRQFFPRIAGARETLRLTVVVMQTINAMVDDLK